LERVSAWAKCSRNYSFNRGPLQERRWRFHRAHGLLRANRCSVFLCESSRNQRGRDCDDKCFHFFSFLRGVQIIARHYALLTLYTSMDYLEKAGRVLDIEIFELKRLRERLNENFSRAVELIKEAVDARGKVVVVGVGKSGHTGAKIAATLTSTGSPAVVLDSSNALHGDL